MAKITKQFQFNYELSESSFTNGEYKKVPVGTLTIEGVAYCNKNASILDIDERYSVDIDYIKWNGTDIKPVLSIGASDFMDKLEAATVRYVAGIFEEDKPAARHNVPDVPRFRLITPLFIQNGRD